ncbi:M24 family metallopeptidase [Rhizobium mesoamericanum]|nr:M24 family metallopeptidase [Rhizobium mesoamericanum]
MKAAKPGVPTKEIEFAARKVISDSGCGDYFALRTGHGTGTEGH